MSTQLKEVVFADLKVAMKEKDTLKKGVLTIIKSNLDSAAKDKKADLTKEEETAVIQREIKQINQSLEAAKTANRQDLIDAEEAKLKLLEVYLPTQVSREEATDVLSNEISSGMNMGEAMKIAKALLNGQIDNKLLSEIVKELIK